MFRHLCPHIGGSELPQKSESARPVLVRSFRDRPPAQRVQAHVQVWFRNPKTSQCADT